MQVVVTSRMATNPEVLAFVSSCVCAPPHLTPRPSTSSFAVAPGLVGTPSRALSYTTMLLNDAIIFDIETVARLDWHDLDDSPRAYLTRRETFSRDTPQDPDDHAAEEAASQKLALSAGTGKIIVVGLMNGATGECGVLIEDDSVEPGAKHPWTPFNYTTATGETREAKALRAPEPDLLKTFWRYVNGSKTLITYNGRNFDGPYLMIRSLMLGITPTRQLVPYRYSFRDHCDLMDVLTFFGATRGAYSLDYWCRCFGIPSPKTGLDGSEVQGAYNDGRIDEIASYCLNDVEATRHLAEKLQPLIAMQSSR